MSLQPNELALEISNALTATGTGYTATVVDLGIYGPSCEITKHGSGRKLHITPVEDSMIDMVLYDDKGTTIAAGTMFAEAVTDLTPEELATIIGICLGKE